MTIPRKKGLARRTEARLVRLTPVELAAWKAGLEPGETLSDMVRGAVDRDLERRREERELEDKRRPPDLAGVNERLAKLLEQMNASSPVAHSLPPARQAQ